MKIDNIEFKFGCDPEIFVKSRKTNKLVSAHNLIPGTKEKPFKVNSGAVQVDGMALEFNINPVSNFRDFNSNINNVMGVLEKMTPDYEFVIEPVAEFGKEYIQSQPEVARRLGCEPDYNAYTKKANPRPDADYPFRTASGHIHISWKKDDENWPLEINPMDPTHFEACCTLVKALDKYVGTPSMLWDKDPRRRELYGAAGAFRPKCYGNGWFGVEYRTLSNKWLQNIDFRSLVFNNTVEAIKGLKQDLDYTLSGVDTIDPKTNEYGVVSVQDIINNSDKQIYRDMFMMLMPHPVKPPSHYRQLREGNLKKEVA